MERLELYRGERMKDNNSLRKFLDQLGNGSDAYETRDIGSCAYMAGMIDADGSVSMKFDGKFRSPIVTVYNNDYSIMEALQIAWGGKISSRNYDNPKWNTSYEIRFNTSESLNIIECILPFMLHTKKKARAKLLNEHYRDCTPRNGKYSKQQLAQKRWLEEEVMSIQMRG